MIFASVVLLKLFFLFLASNAYLAVGYKEGIIDIFALFTWKWIAVCHTNSNDVKSLDWDTKGDI